MRSFWPTAGYTNGFTKPSSNNFFFSKARIHAMGIFIFMFLKPYAVTVIPDLQVIPAYAGMTKNLRIAQILSFFLANLPLKDNNRQK